MLGTDIDNVIEADIGTGASTTETTIDFQIAIFGQHTLTPDMVIL
jgi:hypothetical protein